MGKIKKLIEIDDEDILNLKHCLERTLDNAVPFTDLWPFTIQHIIEEWNKK